jgi:hypothetical protein
MSKKASTQAAKAVVRRYTEEVQSKGNLDVSRNSSSTTERSGVASDVGGMERRKARRGV